MCCESLGNVIALVSDVFYYFQHFYTQVAGYKVFISRRYVVKLLRWVEVPAGSGGDRRGSLLTASGDVISDHDSWLAVVQIHTQGYLLSRFFLSFICWITRLHLQPCIVIASRANNLPHEAKQKVLERRLFSLTENLA